MGEKFGAPYSTFPFSSMAYGKSSTAESGGTCGCLISGAHVISLFFPPKIAIPLQKELQRWYEVTNLPVFKPTPQASTTPDEIIPTTAGSILCHISVARWCRASDFASGSQQRMERCSRVSADTAVKVASLINAQMDGAFKPEMTRSEMYQSCTTEGCHGPNKDDFANANYKGTMDCAPCHAGGDFVQDKRIDHP